MVCQTFNYWCLYTSVDMQTQWKKTCIINPLFVNHPTIRHYKEPESLKSAITYIYIYIYIYTQFSTVPEDILGT